MSSFDKIIGYDKIKEELTQICDMIRNREFYEGLGAKTRSRSSASTATIRSDGTGNGI